MLEELMPGQKFHAVPMVTTVMTGIQATRNVFASCWFDQTACAQGLKRLGNYKKTRSEEHTSELQSLMRISYAVFCLYKKTSIHTETLYLITHATTNTRE